MNITIFNVKYSNNLGDGIVAETTEYLVDSLTDGNSILTVDLGGRIGYGDAGIKAPTALKNMASRVLRNLPEGIANGLRHKLTYSLLQRDALPRWRVAIEKADRVVIGGGHLISDSELYFPIRLHAIVSLAMELQKPVYIHAVGVSNPTYFSTQGRKLFCAIFKNNPYLHYVSVRDELSRQNWCSIFGGDVTVVPDPGNFARETYVNFPCEVAEGVVGVGVMASGLVVNDTPGRHTKVVLSVADYIELGKQLVKLGYTPLYFTNGSPEDELVLLTIKQNISTSLQAVFADRPMVPEDLVKTILRCEKIIAYRLHACIVATSLGVPVIGLAWDKKLSSYFESIGAPDRICVSFNAAAIAKQLAHLNPLDVSFTKEPYLQLIR